MILLDVLTVTLIVAGTFFFIAGTAGLLRFPDLHARIHALTKADNLGLGLIVLGLLLQISSVTTGLKMILIWLLTLMASATSAFLIASRAESESETGLTNER